MTASAPAAGSDLAIVIPVWNLPDDLSALLAQVAATGIFAQVVVVDDASDPPCDPATLGFDRDRLGAALVYLRSEQRRGAGHARNIGLQQVTTANVLFFDADDQLAPDLAAIWHRHAADPEGLPDFSIFRHNDTRVQAKEGRDGSFQAEEDLWDRALGTAGLLFLNRDERALLSTISAYPWNKIYRTAFLRDHAITCSETPVHNDIRLHWLSFAYAQRVLAMRLIGATHVIGGRDHHLTARRGPERLCLFEILAELTPRLREAPDQLRLMRQFIRFTDNICRWNLRQIDPDLSARFRQLTRRAYLDFRPEEFTLFAQENPEQAERMVDFLIREGL